MWWQITGAALPVMGRGSWPAAPIGGMTAEALINLSGYVIFARLVAARRVAERGNLLKVGLKKTATGARRAGNLISWGNA